METKEIFIDSIELGNKVDITDPCYKRNVWCRINDVPVMPGEYICKAKRVFMDGAYMDDEDMIHFPTNHSDSRIAEIKIIYREYESFINENEWEFVGEIGVDAGLAGFLPSPYSAPEGDGWSAFCDKIGRLDDSSKIPEPEDAYGVKYDCLYGTYYEDDRFFSLSGYGDGGYDVFGIKKGDVYVALKIVFISDNEENDDNLD